MGPLGTNQSAFGIRISGLEVRGFDRGVDVETNGNVFIVDGTTAEANNDGLYVASGFVTVTPGAAGPVHFDGNLAFGVYVDGASGLFFQGVHTAAGGRSITVNDNAAGGVRLSTSNNLWQYLFTLEMRGNPTGALLYLEQPVSVIDSIIADNGVGIELLPYASASIANSGWTNLGNDTAPPRTSSVETRRISAWPGHTSGTLHLRGQQPLGRRSRLSARHVRGDARRRSDGMCDGDELGVCQLFLWVHRREPGRQRL